MKQRSQGEVEPNKTTPNVTLPTGLINQKRLDVRDFKLSMLKRFQKLHEIGEQSLKSGSKRGN